jgi:hypothetical protein
MLIYEHERTIAIVERLTSLPDLVRLVILIASTLGMAILTTLVSVFILTALWWLGALLGGLIGFALGLGVAAITNVMIEWMAQLLVAEGEILAELKNR